MFSAIYAPAASFVWSSPDLEHLARSYVDSSSADASHTFMVEAHLGEEATPGGFASLARTLFGRSHHLWMWDFRSIRVELANAGFTSVRRAQYGDSGDPLFAQVEDPGRWKDCLGVECRRPN